MMGFSICNIYSSSNAICALIHVITPTHHSQLPGNTLMQNPTIFGSRRYHFKPVLVASNVEQLEKFETEEEENKARIRWVEIGPDITEDQKNAISKISPKMTRRCKALMKNIICFDPENFSLSILLAAWVKSMKPVRADWLSVLKELDRLDHSMYLEIAELALLEESFEANVRDYTKIIYTYGKQNRLQDAENILLAMKSRGFICDQVILTALVHMYSKAGNLKLAEDTFEEMKLLGVPLDRRSYGSIIMAYVRAGMLKQGESFIREMEAQEIYAGREVYKALLRAYSMIGDSEGSQRVFDTIQLAGVTPDAKLCGLLINAYVVAGQSQEACVAFENLRRAGLEPNDKCVALILAGYEKENKISKALNFLIDLERDGTMVGKESSELLAGWFRRLGVIEEVELVLREYGLKETKCKVPAF